MMAVNDMIKEMDSGTSEDVEMDSPFVKPQTEEKSINRTELMEKTGKQLAVMCTPYSPLKLKTLEKMAKSDLCDIILSKGQNKEQKEAKGRSGTSKSDSEAIIDTMLAIAESFKMKREQEPLNATAKTIFKNNAVNLVDKKVDEEEISSHGVNTAVAVFTGAFLLVDGLVGIANIPTLFSKMKSKFNAKPNTK